MTPQTPPCPPCLDPHLIQHYRARKCHPIIPGGCRCPSRFNCHEFFDENNDGVLQSMHSRSSKSSLFLNEKQNKNHSNGSFEGRSQSMFSNDEFDENFDKCFHDGNYYKIGDIVPTEDVCRICVCSYMFDGTLSIDCNTKIECPTRGASKVSEFYGYFTEHTPLFFQQQPRLRRRPYDDDHNHSDRDENGTDTKQAPLTLHCYDYYSHDQCCPRQECMPINSRTGRTIRPRKTCRFDGIEYNLGERIKLTNFFTRKLATKSNDLVTKNNNNNNNNNINIESGNNQSENGDDRYVSELLICNTCICTEQWNDSIGDNLTKLIEYLDDPNQISCRRKSCYLDFDLRFRRGCLPVYDHNKCCPIDFICLL
ncbi:hypothetical protein QR98_0100850 [Sarcoptes scabiei]|uniref:Uncharacterized protein n=1 Tax=Sarcoptes scabiei TaxID=52283 RepID=A0A132AKR6_SARSC|nr:hypothetical protein QR98_0100850 [Sarcoptes scabiei]